MNILADIHQQMDKLRPDQLVNVIGLLSAMLARAQARLLHTGQSAVPSLPDAGHYLSVDEVTERFHVTKVWLYRHKSKLPHSQPSRKVLLFPERAISQWFANRKGA
jgi:hypothetical protein